MKILGASAFLLLCIAICCGGGRNATDTSKDTSACLPSFRSLRGSSLSASVGKRTITFESYLIGCRDDLLSIREDKLGRMAKELENPTEWSVLAVWASGVKPEFRAIVTNRLNEIAGKKAVTDILIACVDNHLGSLRTRRPDFSSPSAAGRRTGTDTPTCVPGFRRLGNSTLGVPADIWRVTFDAYLIGCDHDIRSLREEALRRMINELEKPTDWDVLELAVSTKREELAFRTKITRKLNETGGDKAVTDVLISCVTVYDYFAQH